jgi:hypothetical protein
MRRLTLLAAIGLALGLAPTCAGHTITVDCGGGGDYSTIQGAVAAAGAGDTILIAACVYEEQVAVPDMPLVLMGEGSDVTEITWFGGGPAVTFVGSPLTLIGLRITHTTPPGYAVFWDEGRLILEDCHVADSWVRGGDYHGAVDIRGSYVGYLWVSGGFVTSTVEHSRIDYAEFTGPWQTSSSLVSSFSSYGELSLAACAQCVSDTIDCVELAGGYDSAASLQADGCVIGECQAILSPPVELVNCVVRDLGYGVWDWFGPFVVQGCLVTGSLIAEPYRGGPGTPSARGDRPRSDYLFEHNTILGEFTLDADPDHEWGEYVVRSNIVVGESVIHFDYPLTVSHNDFAGGLDLVAPEADVFDNIAADPQFCNAQLDDYTVHEDSPCNGGAHDGGVIGAFGVGCGVPVERWSWGQIKATFR